MIRHRWLAVLATIAILGAVAIPALSMRLGLTEFVVSTGLPKVSFFIPQIILPRLSFRP